MTVSEAHARAVDNDRVLRICGVIQGKWFEDHILSYVNLNGEKEVEPMTENDHMVTVRLK